MAEDQPYEASPLLHASDQGLQASASASSPFGAEGAQLACRSQPKEPSQRSMRRREPIRQPERQLTTRAVAVGLIVGSILCGTNQYFGLQSGWVTMGSLQSAILGFGIFSIMQNKFGAARLTIEENVILSTTAVATATMPLAAGFVGIIPAFSLLPSPVIFSPWQLILWSLALAFIGVFCALPLRTQTIVSEQLKFPSGTATANVIRTLHGVPESQEVHAESMQHRHSTLESLPETVPLRGFGSARAEEAEEALPAITDLPQVALSTARSNSKGLFDLLSARSLMKADSMQRHASLDSKWTSMRLKANEAESTDFQEAWRLLLITFVIAGAYSLASGLWPPLKSFPVFTWIGLPSVTAWGWELSPSTGYVGQGMIMGPRTAFSMLLGAITGYGILGPLAKRNGWAPGEIMDWKTGATGWILWVSLSVMLADSITSLLVLCWMSISKKLRQWRSTEVLQPVVDKDHGKLPTWVWVGGLLTSGALCTAVFCILLKMRFYEPIAAVVLALLIAILAVRALGETDLNPVSGVGKLSQVVFAIIAPRQVVTNLAAGAIAEAGAQQAGDMMQDFKVAYLLGVCPRAQFIAMLIGSAASVFVSTGAYLLFTTSYTIPGPLFPAPTAEIWLDMAELVNGGHLPHKIAPFCITGAVFGATLPLVAAFLEQQTKKLEQEVESSHTKLRLVTIIRRFLPSGIGFAVGMYVQARWTLPRVLGSVIEQFWLWRAPKSHSRHLLIIASGLVLGEGTLSVVAAGIQAFFKTR